MAGLRAVVMARIARRRRGVTIRLAIHRFSTVRWRVRRARLAQEAEGCCRLASTKLVHRLNDPLAIW